MSFEPPILKTKIGQHDFHKPICTSYCKLSKSYCPLSVNPKSVSIVRWTDQMDKKRGEITGEKESGKYTVTVGSGASDSSKYCCWGDGSGFEYDIMSRNVIGQGTAVEHVYDIFRYGIEHKVLEYGEWNAWIDKFQYDYRFGRVSDTNAECILFPNVDNPWMFTEYVFQGVSGNKKVCALDIPTQYIAQPPIYDPQTLQIINADFKTDIAQYDEKYKQQLQYQNQAEGKNAKQFRQIINWNDLGHFSEEQLDNDEEKYEKLNKNAKSIVNQTCPQAGVKLYRVKVPVQSVKWGEHGNIPPHTVDMTAPKDWLDPQAGIGKLKAVYDAHVGSPFYSPYDGVISWGKNSEWPALAGNRQAFINQQVVPSPSLDTNGKRIYTYSSSGGGTALDMPRKWNDPPYVPDDIVMGDDGQDNYCHGGCSLCHGRDGLMTCAYIQQIDNDNKIEINKMNALFTSACWAKGGNKSCEYNVAGKPNALIATYQMTMINTHQTNIQGGILANYMGFGAMGGVLGATTAVAMAGNAINNIYNQIREHVASFSKRGDLTVTYSVRYEVQPSSKNTAKLNKQPQKNDEFGKGVQIVPGTGKYAFDSEKDANPFSGGDTNVYNDISTLSFHRFFQSVMHCATQKNCNIFLGQSQALGYDVNIRAGGDGKCRYFNYGRNKDSLLGCPYNCTPKRAIEFSHVARDVASYVNNYMALYEKMTYFGIWELNAATKKDEDGKGTNSGVFYETVGLYTKQGGWVVFSDWAVYKKSAQIAIIAVKHGGENKNIDYSAYHGGAALLYDAKCPKDFKLFCQIRTKQSKMKIDATPWYERGSSSSGDSGLNPTKPKTIEITIAKCLQGFYWYYPLKNDGSSISNYDFFTSKIGGSSKLTGPLDIHKNFWQHTDENGYWFCKVEQKTAVPNSNCIIIDNEEKFIGGWHPEYKDYSKLGPEFMQEIVSDESRQGQGIGDYVNNGDYTPIPQETSQQGYWVDQSGEYIIDQRSIGWDQPIAYASQRQNNSGPGVCISFKKSNTTTNSMGQTIPPKVINGAVFSNDPVSFWQGENAKYVATIPEGGFELEGGNPWFRDPINDYQYYAPCFIANKHLLPTRRPATYCPTCDYYISERYQSIDKCPWCGTEYISITGSTVEKNQGEDWTSQVQSNQVIKKFFKLNALGNVDVWAPPGTSVRMDAYFWKHQAQITNATKKQMYNRLNGSNSTASELTLGYPEGVGKYERVPYLTMSEFASSSTERFGEIQWDLPDVSEENAKMTIDGMYNPLMPRHMIPGLYNDSDDGEDQGVIAPYSLKENDALKMVSLAQIVTLRNQVQPLYAYSSKELYGTDYPTKRASYDLRTTADQPIIYTTRKALVKPVVLAHTQGSYDAYQQYYSGDMVYGNVREYFPNGYTWWNMKQVVGGRFSTLCGGQYHMDTEEFKGWAPHVLYPTSQRTIAKCALSIYGLLPLDKIILKAYVVISKSGVQPSKDPIGRSWNGGPVMYHHYHSFPQRHDNRNANDGSVSEGEMKGDYLTGDGQKRHLHGTAGYPPGTYFDQNGIRKEEKNKAYYIYMSDEVTFQDQANSRLWGGYSDNIDDDRNLYYDDNFLEMMTNLPCLYDKTFYRNVGVSKKQLKSLNEEDENIYWGYDNNSFPNPAGWLIYNLGNTARKREQKYQYIVLNKDNDLVQKYPDSMIWKNMTEEEIQNQIDDNTVEVQFGASDGTQESYTSYVFTERNSKIYKDLIPQQSQNIPGYFDMSWTNTQGYVYDNCKIERNVKKQWDAPVIFQASTPSPSSPYSGGVSIDTNTGCTSRCLDVTDIVKGLYESRIERKFKAKGGTSISILKTWSFYKAKKIEETDATKITQLQNQNSQEDFSNGYLLTDTKTYPQLSDNISFVPEISADGDKYELAPSELELIAVASYPIIIKKGENDTIKKDGESVTLTAGLYVDYDEFESLIKSVFTECSFEKLSFTKIKIKSNANITIEQNVFGIQKGEYKTGQNRIIQVSNYNPGHHPVNLMGAESSGSWTYKVYTEQPQSFVVDLLRAPLLIKQQNWRYEQNRKDYSGCKCPNENCKASKMGCSVAANMSNVFFNGKNSKCPICGTDLSSAEGVMSSNGDGIKTYFYDHPFDENAFITSIEYTSHKNCGVRIYGKYSKHDTWKILVHNSEVLYDPEKTRARFLKVECDSKSSDDFNQYSISSYNKYSITITGDFSDMEKVPFDGLSAVIGKGETSIPDYDDWISGKRPGNDDDDGEDFDDLTEQEQNIEKFCDDYGYRVGIVSAQIIGQDKKTMKILLDRRYPPLTPDEKEAFSAESLKQFQFFLKIYEGGVKKFKAKGFHYKTKENSQDNNIEGSKDKFLVITDAQDEFTTNINYSDFKYRMPEPPTQIFKVLVGKNCGSIELTAAASEKGLKWTTQEVSVSGIVSGNSGDDKIIKITGGSYFYDAKTGYIHIPDRNEEGILNVEFEKALQGTYSTESYFPNKLTIYYWSGNGKSVTLRAEAIQNGPSYMLEKNAIRNIITELPSNGVSCDMLDIYGKVVSQQPIPWICYNNKPSTLSVEHQSRSTTGFQGSFKTDSGYFRAPLFCGNQLGVSSKGTDDQYFVDFFGENATKCYGICETEITLTGAPNQVIAGDIQVSAPASVSETIELSGGEYMFTQLTGGIANGFIIVQCAPSNARRRGTVCYNIPSLLIYARDRQIGEI